MICLLCGAEIGLGEKHCSKCGHETNLAKGINIGKITVTRPKNILGCLISFKVYIDDRYLGKLSNGVELKTDIEYGTHQIKIMSFNKEVVKEVELNKEKDEATLYVKVKMGLISGEPNIYDVK